MPSKSSIRKFKIVSLLLYLLLYGAVLIVLENGLSLCGVVVSAK